MVRALIAAGAMLPLLMGLAVLPTEPAELRPLAFLIGEWSASGAEQPGAASGRAVFARGLQDRVIVRTSYAEYPAVAGNPGSRHDDLMIIYAASGGVRADYYDNEGHVIRYVVSSPAPGHAVFLSEAVGGEARFRLSYTLEATGVLRGELAIAPPGAPDSFKQYLSWESRKGAARGRP